MSIKPLKQANRAVFALCALIFSHFEASAGYVAIPSHEAPYYVEAYLLQKSLNAEAKTLKEEFVRQIVASLFNEPSPGDIQMNDTRQLGIVALTLYGKCQKRHAHYFTKVS